MRRTLNSLQALTVLSVLITAAVPSAAQLQSHSAQITIVARMPETLGLAVNSSAPLSTAVTVNNPDSRTLATGVTTTWNLERGRAQVATWADIDRKIAPVQVALATGIDVSPFTGASAEPRLPYKLTLPRTTSSTELDATSLGASNLLGAKTISLSDSSGTSEPQAASKDAYAGTIKITVQAVL